MNRNFAQFFPPASSQSMGGLVPLLCDDIAVGIDGNEWLKSGYITRDKLAYPDAIFIQNLSPQTAACGSGIIAYSPTLNRFARVSGVAGINTAATLPVKYSSDGITWSDTNAPAMVAKHMIWADNLSLFVAVGEPSESFSHKCITSPDGINWTARNLPANGRAVAYSPTLNLLVAIIGNTASTTQFATSADGVTWTARTVPGGSWCNLAWCKAIGKFVAVGGSGDTNRLAISPDGIDWTVVITSTTTYQGFSGVNNIACTEEAVFVSNSNGVFKSINGSDWSLLPGSPTNSNIVWLDEQQSLLCFPTGSTNAVGKTVLSKNLGLDWTVKDSVYGYNSAYSATAKKLIILGTGQTGSSSNYICSVFDEYAGSPAALQFGNAALDLPVNYYVRIK